MANLLHHQIRYSFIGAHPSEYADPKKTIIFGDAEVRFSGGKITALRILNVSQKKKSERFYKGVNLTIYDFDGSEAIEKLTPKQAECAEFMRKCREAAEQCFVVEMARWGVKVNLNQSI